MIGRRNLLTATGLGALALVAGCSSPRPRTGSGTRRTRFPEAPPVINGNLSIPQDATTPFDVGTKAMIRGTGLSAAKFTLGGGGDRSREQVEAEIAAADQMIALNADVYLKVGSYGDIRRAQETGRVGLIYSFEASEMLEGSLEAIDRFRDTGVLVMGLSYNRTTPFASGTMSPDPTGLTDLGRRAVARMDAAGMTIDVSHSDEPSSLAAIGASQNPVLITHAGCSAIHPHPRNGPIDCCGPWPSMAA